MTYVNGDVYEGEWVENAREGHGTYWKHEYGRHRAEYVGEWRRGKREGFGVFHDELGQRFEGDWVRSKRHGRGRQTAIANAEDREYQTDGSNVERTNVPGVDVYEGMVVGIHQRSGDLKVNVAKRKAATNVRSNKDATVVLNEPKNLSLDDCVEYIGEDELVEVTPLSVRILKNPKMDKKAMKQQGKK